MTSIQSVYMDSNIEVRRRASRIVRSSIPRPMILTHRDMLVIKAVNDFRVLRQDQIQRLFFPSRNTAQVRLQLLWQHGFLRREFLPVRGGMQNSPILYVLDARGAKLLQSDFGYDRNLLRWSPKQSLDPLFLQHTIGLAEIRVMVELSCYHHKYKLKEWRDERMLKADYDRVLVRNKMLAVLPDAYFVVNISSGDVHFFVEYDSGSESLNYFRQKVLAYWTYYLSGKCKTRYGTDLIRVLVVTASENMDSNRRRLEKLRGLAAQFRENRWFYFTTLATISAGDFFAEPIWQLAHSDAQRPLLGR